MATGETNIGGSVLPQDLMIEILSWLPVKILMRLRCVCKYWNSVIGSRDPIFASKHLQNYYHSTRNTDGRLFLQCAHHEYDTSANALFSDPALEDLSYQYVDGVPGIYTCVLGPCNGIFLLWNQYSLAKALWNPATKECKLLPQLQIPIVPQPFGSYEDFYGFGWDPLAEGFKVVIIQQELYNCCGPSDKDSRVLVYNDSSESWSSFTLSPRYFSVMDSPCYSYLNGAYYWSVYDRDGDYIISFDMGTGLFTRVISTPDDGRVRDDAFDCLMVYDDSIAWCQFDRSVNYLHLWLMSRDGDCNCWSRLFSIGPFLDFYFPIGYWKDGQMILHSRRGVFLFDPKSGVQGIRHLGITTLTCSMMLIYKESFVPLNGESYFPEVPPSWIDLLDSRQPPPCACDLIISFIKCSSAKNLTDVMNLKCTRLVLTWPPAFCANPHEGRCMFSPVPKYFVVHGVWGVDNCDDTIYCKPKTKGEKMITVVEDDKKLEADMLHFLPNLITNDRALKSQSMFWQHEWDKHGDCTQSNAEWFLRMTIWKIKNYDITSALAKRNFNPGNEYKLTEFKGAITSGLTNANDITIKCYRLNGVDVVQEIGICFDRKKLLSITSCPPALVNHLQRSCGEIISFLG